MPNDSIQVKELRKSFKDTEVLKGVDLEVKRGEIFTLLGSNGAGKTTIVPTESMPPFVRAFAENQPVTSIVNAIRALLSSKPVGNEI